MTPSESSHQPSPQMLSLSGSRTIAYHLSAPAKADDAPHVVFLGGLRSDMTGKKATCLESWAQERGCGFLRFDYTGHGASSGAFENGCIGDWAQDAFDAISELTPGRVLLIGSSMGGWISLLMAKRAPERVAGLIGVAAAPDFTEDAMWAQATPAQREEMRAKGLIHLPSDYGDPYPITMRLIEDGRKQLVLRAPLAAKFPVRLLHGTADTVVSQDVPQRLLEHLDGDDIRLTFVKGGDHSLSEPADLELLRATANELMEKARA